MTHHKKCLIDCRDFSLGYISNAHSADSSPKVPQRDSPSGVVPHGDCPSGALDGKDNAINGVIDGITFQLMQGDILFLSGNNGCGKSSLIKKILSETGAKNDVNQEDISNMVTDGRLEVASGLVVSYINQNTSHLSGSLKDYAEKHSLDYSLLLTLLRKLDMNRVQFEKNIEEYSEGQKKKVLIAASLLTSAHLYIWDEPMNYIDVFSRMQIEKLIEVYKPTMIMVEHDARFREKLATTTINL